MCIRDRPTEGLGLNPILQDPALAIHPPVLYLGYVGSSIIFSSVLAATSLKIISTSWASHIKKWILISWIFLTLGILLGSIWAYYELGLSLIHISEPTRPLYISYAVFCLGIPYKKMDFNFMDIFDFRNTAWINLGLLRIGLGRFLVLGSS